MYRCHFDSRLLWQEAVFRCDGVVRAGWYEKAESLCSAIAYFKQTCRIGPAFDLWKYLIHDEQQQTMVNLEDGQRYLLVCMPKEQKPLSVGNPRVGE